MIQWFLRKKIEDVAFAIETVWTRKMLIDELKGQKTTYCTQIEEISPLVLGETAHEIKLIHICKSTAYKIMARRRVTSFIDARQTRFSKYSITQTPKDTEQSWFSRTCESCNFHSSVCFIFGARDTCVYDLYRSVVSNQHGFNTFLVTDGFPKNNFNLKFWVILVSCTDRCKKSDWNSIGISGKLSICLRKKNDLYQ